MTVYTGAIKGGGTLSGDGFSLHVSTSDAVTANLTIDPNGSFTGTEDQAVTVTVSGDGQTSTKTTDFNSPVSGNVNQPDSFTETVLGQTVDAGASFTSGDKDIVAKGDTDINYDGFSGPISESGTLKEDNVQLVIAGKTSVQEPIKPVGGQYIEAAEYKVSVKGDTDPNDIYNVTIHDDTLTLGTNGASVGLPPSGNYEAFNGQTLQVSPGKPGTFGITVINDKGADDISKGSQNDGSILFDATGVGSGVVGNIQSSPFAVKILESKLRSSAVARDSNGHIAKIALLSNYIASSIAAFESDGGAPAVKSVAADDHLFLASPQHGS